MAVGRQAVGTSELFMAAPIALGTGKHSVPIRPERRYDILSPRAVRVVSADMLFIGIKAYEQLEYGIYALVSDKDSILIMDDKGHIFQDIKIPADFSAELKKRRLEIKNPVPI